MDIHDLTPLRAAIAAAKGREAEALKREGVRPVVPTYMLLEPDEWQLALDVVDLLRDEHRQVYRLYLSERYLGGLIVSLLEDDERLDWPGLVAALRDRAAEAGAWLVATPLANLDTESRAVALGDDAMLCRTNNSPEHDPSDDDDRMELWRHFDDRLRLRPRFRIRQDVPVLDTRNGAAIVSVERSTQELALSIARSRARYALAVWTLLKLPTGEEVWPSVGTWGPQPHMLFGQEFKPFEPGAWTGASTTKRSTAIHAAYGASTDQAQLRAPFDAMAVAEKSRCAQALLSSAWSLYLAGCTPSPIEWTDRLLGVYEAVMALCEPPGEPVADDVVFGRWQRVADRLGAWDDLTERGYSRERIQHAHARIRDARNIATHGADSVLINLGYPADATRTVRGPRDVPGDDLALAVIRADWAPLLFAARTVVTKLWIDAPRQGFDHAWFESHFA